jgi:integrase/recombinase XerD
MHIPEEWRISIETINQQKRIAIRFDKNNEWIAMIKNIAGARWEPKIKAWHIADHPEHRKILGLLSEDTTKKSLSRSQLLNETSQKQLNKFIDWMRSGRYSERTIAAYVKTLQIFISFFKFKRIEDVTNDDILDFNRDYIFKHKLSASYQSQFINALKLFYGLIADKKMVIDKMVRPQKPFQLP